MQAKESPERQRFKLLFPDLAEELLADVRNKFSLNPKALAYVEKNITYNVPHGKLNRGLAVFQCFKAFYTGLTGKDLAPDSEYEKQANILGWCVEFLQAFFLVADDIMDDSVTRRGQPCYYRLPEIGLRAVNDSLMLEMMLYQLVRKHFGSNPELCSSIIELFMDITYVTIMGQMLDLTSQNNDGVVDLSLFTEKTLAQIYKYKTAHYTFYLPVALGMRLAGVKEASKFEEARDICMDMGHYFQAQDDYLDCFGDPEVTGKVGTDIEDNTCTWLVVEFLKIASEKEKEILAQNYGKKDKEAVETVKNLYRKVDLPKAYAEYEERIVATMRKKIDAIHDMPTGAFSFLLDKLYKRSK